MICLRSQLLSTFLLLDVIFAKRGQERGENSGEYRSQTRASLSNPAVRTEVLSVENAHSRPRACLHPVIGHFKTGQ